MQTAKKLVVKNNVAQIKSNKKIWSKKPIRLAFQIGTVLLLTIVLFETSVAIEHAFKKNGTVKVTTQSKTVQKSHTEPIKKVAAPVPTAPTSPAPATNTNNNTDTVVQSDSHEDGIQTTLHKGVYSITLDTPLHDVRFVSEEAISIFLKDKGVLAGLGPVYYQAGGANQMPGELLVSIATHETSKGTSYIARNFNNLGGMICNSGSGFRIYNGCGKMPGGDNLWQKYNLKEESVYHKAQLLKADYIDHGKDTIRDIWMQYAPTEASNDPQGLNKGWGPGVLNYFNQILAIQKQLDKGKK